MTEYERLKDILKKKPFLVATVDGNVKLVDEAEAVRLMIRQDESLVIQNLARALEGFAKLRGVGKSDKTFRREDIAEIAGITPQGAWLLVQKGVLIPSVRHNETRRRDPSLYSWSDAFVAGVIGSLRRHGLDKHVLSKIQPLLSESKPKTKRTAKRMTASQQS